MQDNITNHDPNCEQIQPDLAALALGETEAAPEVAAHLRTCPACRATLREYIALASGLRGTPDVIEPPQHLRQRIIAAVEAESGTKAVPPAPAPTPVRQPRPSLLHHPTVRWVTAAALLLALLLWNMSIQRQLGEQRELLAVAQSQVAASRDNWSVMTRLLNAPDLHWYNLGGTTTNGHFWLSENEGAACLTTKQLPPLADNQVFQVWFGENGSYTSGGTFRGRDGMGWLLLQLKSLPKQYDTVRVTMEPRGGSATPTGPVVLEGKLANQQRV